VAPQPPFPASIPAAFATALAATPDGRLFYAERSGTIRVWQDGGTRVFARVPTVTTEAGGGYSERGLLGLAVSPRFAQDRFLYAFYSHEDRAHQDIVRFTDCAGEARDRRLLVQLPAGKDCCHKGGRIAFGPDGTLFVTLGDQHVASAAQDTGDVRGKLLRYNADGSVPADNPFGAGNPVWAFGFRNPFGLSVSASGQVAVTSNGPTGDAGSPRTGYDTVMSAVARGTGYQWPVCYGYSHPIPPATSCPPGQPGPDWSSETTTAVPTGAAWVDGAGPAAYAGRLVFCTLNGGMRILTPGPPPPPYRVRPAAASTSSRAQTGPSTTPTAAASTVSPAGADGRHAGPEAGGSQASQGVRPGDPSI
jgi:glucose/arabinose dehydrogenase